MLFTPAKRALVVQVALPVAASTATGVAQSKIGNPLSRKVTTPESFTELLNGCTSAVKVTVSSMPPGLGTTEGLSELLTDTVLVAGFTVWATLPLLVAKLLSLP